MDMKQLVSQGNFTKWTNYKDITNFTTIMFYTGRLHPGGGSGSIFKKI